MDIVKKPSSGKSKYSKEEEYLFELLLRETFKSIYSDVSPLLNNKVRISKMSLIILGS